MSSCPAKPLVIHVLTSLDFGGVERHMELIASAFDHAQMRHIFVALGRGGATELNLRSLGADVRCLQEKTKIPSLPALRSLLKLLNKERPLVVHAHGAEANFHGLIAAWLARVPVRIGEEIGIPNHGLKTRTVFRLIYGMAHRVVGISQSVTDWLIASREAPQHKATRIYNPVRLPELKKSTPAQRDVFRIGFNGRLEPVKNPIALLEAFGEILADDISSELWFIGEGSERIALTERISQMGLTEKVKLWGYQSDPAELIRQCHVYVQPSISEGFGLALVEAMGCGVPVIATAVGGAPEIIKDGETGWLLPKATSELIANALRVAHDFGDKKLSEVGMRGRKSVEGRFEPKEYLSQIEYLYSEIERNRSE